MIKVFKRWLAEAVYDGLQQPKEADRINKLRDMFSGGMAAVVAFKIDNGFIVRIPNTDNPYAGERVRGFVYCADHQAIADHLISLAMKDKLGVQSDMFEKEKEAAVRQYTSAQPRGLNTAQRSI